ncbi:hypothetical protein CRM22_004734 [Opisthorchis felineus]|uniref:Apoptosis-antagonizing transcription factor C-terminal domain-containing protein n=1 Tax=Opisthorchis felineus TaxID=147828 RepID=A0A4S2M081_OPIFE|nr:hypothetical protein CRM22_004734 [Opisthorchis felineus]
MNEEISSDDSIDCDDIQIDPSYHQQPVEEHVATSHPLNKIESKKPKRVVDVRASKGRVLRYLRLPKAVDFMSPDTTEYFSQTQRNNLFAQLRANKD